MEDETTYSVPGGCGTTGEWIARIGAPGKHDWFGHDHDYGHDHGHGHEITAAKK